MNLYIRSGTHRLNDKQVILIASALKVAAKHWLKSAAVPTVDAKDKNTEALADQLLDMAGEAKALAYLIDPPKKNGAEDGEDQ